MPAVCSAYNCPNRKSGTTNISFYKFPLKDKGLTKTWVVNMRRDNWFPTSASYLCSAHFEEKYMYRTNDQRRLLSKAVPTIFSFPPHLQRKNITPRPAPRKRTLEVDDSVVTSNEPSVHMRKNIAPRPVPRKKTIVVDGSVVTSNEPSVHVPTAVASDHNYDLPGLKKMKAKYERVQEQNVKLRMKLKQMEKQRVRNQKKIVKLENLLIGLNKRLRQPPQDLARTPSMWVPEWQIVGPQSSILLGPFSVDCGGASEMVVTPLQSAPNVLKSGCVSDVLTELLKLEAHDKVPQYSQDLRKFALTLHLYSAQAYRYLRKFMKLPHPRTLCQWASSEGGDTGSTEESLGEIQSEVKASTDKISGTLMFDEMAIKNDLVWDGKTITEYVDLGDDGLESDDDDIAKKVALATETPVANI